MSALLGRADARLPLVIGLLLGLQPLTTDLYLPALPALSKDLAAPLASVQLTMSMLILSFGLGQLVWGPLADRYGRRPVLLLSLALYTAAGVGCAWSGSIESLVAWRTAQGAMLAAAVVCARSMVRDRHEPAEGALVMSRGMSYLALFALGGPMLGGWLTDAIGWRAAMAAVAGFGVVALAVVAWAQPETLPRAQRRSLQPGPLLQAAVDILRHRQFRAWALLVSSTYAGLFVMLSVSSFVYIGTFGLSPSGFGAVMAAGSLAYLIGTWWCRRQLPRVGLRGAVRQAAGWTLAGGGLMGACALMAKPPVVGVVLAQCLYAFAHGTHQPCGQTGAVGPFPERAGLASALAGALLCGVAFLVGGWLGLQFDGSLGVMAAGIVAGAGITGLVALTVVQRDG
jgi:MFS transporter, DHA1 family, multidrug resistance protein